MAWPDYIDDKVRALIGFEGEPEEACHPVEESELRRFQHAIMDAAPRYGGQAGTTRYVPAAAPATFPTFAFRRPRDQRDPLDALGGQPDHDGLDNPFRNLPWVPVPLRRILNGGYEYTFYRFARVGERLFRICRYRDIYQRNGRDGPLIFVILDDLYFGADRDLMLTSTQTIIMR